MKKTKAADATSPKAPKAPEVPKVTNELGQSIRDRIKEFRRVPTEEILDNERNWRVHPYAQQKALAEALQSIGIADTLTAYHSQRNGGKLTLIDGHERRSSHKGEWPTIILDVTDEEADQLLLTMDPITNMASINNSKLEELLANATVAGPGLEDLMRTLKNQIRDGEHVAMEEAAEMLERESKDGPTEMELQPFEHYDCLIIPFRTTLDFLHVCEKLGVKRAAFTLKDGKTKKVGLNRVVDGAKLLEYLK